MVLNLNIVLITVHSVPKTWRILKTFLDQEDRNETRPKSFSVTVLTIQYYMLVVHYFTSRFFFPSSVFVNNVSIHSVF